MITFSIDEITARYLPYNFDFCKDFLNWLEKLGFSRLPHGLTPYDFVKFGWIEPVLRVDIPESFYLTWKNYPELPADDSEFPEEDKWALYCKPYSSPTLDDPPEKWFLHVFDKPDSEAREFLRHKVQASQNIPENKEHHRGHGKKYNTCWLYFAYWQGFHLIDLLTHIDIFPSVPNIPNALERLELFKKQYPKRKEITDAGIKAIKEKWAMHRKFFEPLSYYRTMLGLSVHYSLRNQSSQETKELKRKGERLLAEYLELTPENLEEITEKLLIVFQEWTWSIKKGSHIHGQAIGQIRKDIYYSIEWLCSLTGETIDTYFKKWRYPDRSQREWAELRKALPFEYNKTIEQFSDLVPLYLKEINKKLPKKERLEGAKLDGLIKKLYKNHIAFRHFCRAFRKLHDYVTNESEIDFRELDAFIDYFLLLAMRTETILFEFLNSPSGSGNHSSLKELLSQLSLKSGSVEIGVNLAKQLWKECTSLKTRPPDPFRIIENKIQVVSCRNQAAKKIAEHILTAGMMRNYFAHHSYLDHMMAKREYAGRGLTSLLVMVLFLASALKN